ncbi:PAS domain-containing protein [Gracilibacillus sp. D59]|uniref:PAS domain-containing protein n=1 Tax=Gracilibacillus sp. D59 TaxID=3457434 RepID=UPI003FCE9EF4
MTLSHQSPFSYQDLISIIQQMPDPIVISELADDDSFIIREANQALIIQSGYTRQDLLNMSPLDLIDKDLLRKVTFDQSALLQFKPLQMESILLTKDETKIPVLIKVKLMQLENGAKYFISQFQDITDKRNTEVLLEKTHQQLESLFVDNPDLIFMLNKQGYFTNINPASERILKYTKAELLSKTFTDIVHEQDLSLFNQSFQQVLNNQTVQVNVRVHDKSGNILTVYVTAVPTIYREQVTGVIGVARDITSEKAISQQLQESEQRYRSLFDNNIDPVLTLDLQGHFVYMNKATEDLMGFKGEEVIGTSFLPHIAPELREYTKNEYAKVLEGNAVQYETCLINKQRERVDLHITVIPIIVDGNLSGVHCLAKNITEKKQLEEKLNYLAYHDYLTTLNIYFILN